MYVTQLITPDINNKTFHHTSIPNYTLTISNITSDTIICNVIYI